MNITNCTLILICFRSRKIYVWGYMLKKIAVIQQLIYNIFISDNRTSFHLWWKVNFVTLGNFRYCLWSKQVLFNITFNFFLNKIYITPNNSEINNQDFQTAQNLSNYWIHRRLLNFWGYSWMLIGCNVNF